MLRALFSRWLLLRTVAAVFAFSVVVSALELTFNWPLHPESGVVFYLTWSGGTPPVRRDKRCFLPSLI